MFSTRGACQAVKAPWFALVLFFAICFCGTTSCTTDGSCAAACAVSSTSCTGVYCDPVFSRCDCPSEALLRADGSCEVFSAAAAECIATYNITITAAAFASPELTGQDLQAGVASAKLQQLVALGAAAGLPSAAEVNISEVKLIPAMAQLSDLTAPTTLLIFDMNFDLCSVPMVAIDPADFEFAFISKLQTYGAFGAGTGATLSVLEFVNLTDAGSGCSGTGNDTQPRPWTGGQTVDEPETDDQSVFVVFLILAVVLVLASTLAVSAWAKARRARLKVVADSEEEHKVAQSPDVDRVLASVAWAFAPADVEDDKVFRESCLDLSEGDIVEVIAGGGGWFYGRVISGSGDITRMGYFPENRVSWIGKIPRAEVACADQHALVFVDHGFTPEDVAECENLRENCLHLEAGEMVEVLAGGSGWLYGQVAGHPERAGYFPENRATWLGTCEENGEAAKTDRGVLVKVVENYSPGSPGDKEEEVAFAESCLALAEGDVVEVAASGGGWVYGRVVGSPERHGYFPETRVSWLGKPVERDPEGNEESQHSRVLSSAEETALREAAAAVTQDAISPSRAVTGADEAAA